MGRYQQKIRNEEGFIAEMTVEDHAFLAGIVKSFLPKKIVEIGVAEGGTTALINDIVIELGISVEMYSVDVCEKYYRDSSKEVGYFFRNTKRNGLKHTFLLGSTIAGQIEKIGGMIDLAIIDTTHAMPGEFLDFLSIYPYMSPDGIIVLHDVNLNQLKITTRDYNKVLYHRYSQCTKILMAVIQGEKYINNTENFANIAAIKINQYTNNSIRDIFWGLSLTWEYIPNESQLNILVR